MSKDIQLPDPEKLLTAAKDELPRRSLDDYLEIINELRGKSFTFREIAEWLKQRGVDADHNAIWRVYSRRMSEPEKEISVLADEGMEREKSVVLPKSYIIRSRKPRSSRRRGKARGAESAK